MKKLLGISALLLAAGTIIYMLLNRGKKDKTVVDIPQEKKETPEPSESIIIPPVDINSTQNSQDMEAHLDAVKVSVAQSVITRHVDLADTMQQVDEGIENNMKVAANIASTDNGLEEKDKAMNQMLDDLLAEES